MDTIEVKFKLLEMAQKYIVDKTMSGLSPEVMMNQAVTLAKESGDDNVQGAFLKIWKDMQPDPYDVDDIIDVAETLLEFVNDKEEG